MSAEPFTNNLSPLSARNGHTAHTTQTLSGPDEEPKATTRDPKVAPTALAPTANANAARKRYSKEEKRRILRLADACTERGQIGALLRREGIYYTTLRLFMQQRDNGLLDVGPRGAKKRGDQEKGALQKQIEQLTKQNQRLADRLEKAEIVIDFQKKLSRLLQIPEMTQD